MTELQMARSDDSRWFGDLKDIAEWDLLLKSFNNHKYKEFVGIRITCDENINYFIDQTRMVEDIIDGIGMKNAKDKTLPYP